MNPSSQPENHLDNDKEDTRPRAVQNGMSQEEYDTWMFLADKAASDEPYTYMIKQSDLTKWLATLIRTEQKKLLAEIGEPKLEDAINEEKTPEGVKSTPKEPNDIFIILSPYFECKDCGELGCPYNPDVPAELAEAIVNYRVACNAAWSEVEDRFYTQKEYEEVIEGRLEDVTNLIDQHTKTMCERARQDELKQLWNSTQPDIVPDGVEANDMSEALHKRIEKLRSEL